MKRVTRYHKKPLTKNQLRCSDNQHDILRDDLGISSGIFPEINTDVPLRNDFLDAFSRLPNKIMNNFVTLLTDMKSNILGSGVANGKMFEYQLSLLLNNFTNFYASPPLNLSNNKNATADILVSMNKNITNVELVKSCIPPNREIQHEVLKQLLDGHDFLDLSLKSYANEACQITTQHGLRTICEDLITDSNLCTDSKILDVIIKDLNRITKGHKIIMSCQTFPITKNYHIYLYDGFSKIDGIKFRPTKQHSRYDLLSEGRVVAYFTYGTTRADAFQRGLWVKDLTFFNKIYEGEFKTNTKLSSVFEVASIDFMENGI